MLIATVSSFEFSDAAQLGSRGYRNSPVMHPTVPETFKPMLFADGEQVAFPVRDQQIPFLSFCLFLCLKSDGFGSKNKQQIIHIHLITYVYIYICKSH